MASFDDIERQLQNILRDAVYEAYDKSCLDLQVYTDQFYYAGSPEYYIRTGAFEGNPVFDGVSGGGNYYEGKLHSEPISYPQMGVSPERIQHAMNYGGLRIQGLVGYWTKTEEKIQENLDSAIASRL